jgi:hypothetical protein
MEIKFAEQGLTASHSEIAEQIKNVKIEKGGKIASLGVTAYQIFAASNPQLQYSTKKGKNIRNMIRNVLDRIAENSPKTGLIPAFVWVTEEFEKNGKPHKTKRYFAANPEVIKELEKLTQVTRWTPEAE